MTRSGSERRTVAYLLDLGLSDSLIGRVMEIPRATVREWRRPAYVARDGRAGCPLCDSRHLDASAYAYLLGLYLGDGYIARLPRTYRLGITLDLKYLGIIDECFGAMRAVRDPGGSVIHFSHPAGGCVVVQSMWRHWTCLFPQHGKGPKHHRRIVLRDWQLRITGAHPGQLLRGLIHSDGWRGINRVRGPNGQSYAYPRYQFTNESSDIRGIFTEACHQAGIKCRDNGRIVHVSRRSDVARMDRIVGPKS